MKSNNKKKESLVFYVFELTFLYTSTVHFIPLSILILLVIIFYSLLFFIAIQWILRRKYLTHLLRCLDGQYKRLRHLQCFEYSEMICNAHKKIVSLLHINNTLFLFYTPVFYILIILSVFFLCFALILINIIYLKHKRCFLF